MLSRQLQHVNLYSTFGGNGLILDDLFSSAVSTLRVQHHAERLLMSDSPLQHMRRIFGSVEGINEAELRRELGEFVCCAGVVSLWPTGSASEITPCGT